MIFIKLPNITLKASVLLLKNLSFIYRTATLSGRSTNFYSGGAKKYKIWPVFYQAGLWTTFVAKWNKKYERKFGSANECPILCPNWVQFGPCSREIHLAFEHPLKTGWRKLAKQLPNRSCWNVTWQCSMGPQRPWNCENTLHVNSKWWTTLKLDIFKVQ